MKKSARDLLQIYQFVNNEYGICIAEQLDQDDPIVQRNLHMEDMNRARIIRERNGLSS